MCWRVTLVVLGRWYEMNRSVLSASFLVLEGLLEGNLPVEPLDFLDAVALQGLALKCHNKSSFLVIMLVLTPLRSPVFRAFRRLRRHS